MIILRNPQNSIGNHLGPYVNSLRLVVQKPLASVAAWDCECRLLGFRTLGVFKGLGFRGLGFRASAGIHVWDSWFGACTLGLGVNYLATSGQR